MISFPSCFLIEFRRFFINQALSFPPCFLIEFRRFFYQLNTQFPPQFPSGLRRFFPTKAMISNATCLLELVSKREGNCNVMKLHDQLHNGSNLIETILYLSKVDLSLIICHLAYLTFLVNLHNQLFESTYAINLLNQLILNWRCHWIVVCCFFRHTYIRGYTPTYWATYNLGG